MVLVFLVHIPGFARCTASLLQAFYGQIMAGSRGSALRYP